VRAGACGGEDELSPMEIDPQHGCPKCGSDEMLTVTLNPHGEIISFTHCNVCGWKRWGRELVGRSRRGRARFPMRAAAGQGQVSGMVGQGGRRGQNPGTRRG
jgi:hypothetical protein